MTAADLLGATVLHTPTGVVGKVTRSYEAGEYEEADCAVVEVEPGHSFCYEPASFEVLTEQEVEWAAAAERMLQEDAMALCKVAAQAGMTSERALLLLRAALEGQLRALGAPGSALQQQE